MSSILGLFEIGGEHDVTVAIMEPSMERDEIGTARLKFAYGISWTEYGHRVYFDATETNEHIYTPFERKFASEILTTLTAFMENCAETHDMEFHRMDGSCSDKFHNMSETIADDVQTYVWERYGYEDEME